MFGHLRATQKEKALFETGPCDVGEFRKLYANELGVNLGEYVADDGAENEQN